MLSWVLRSCVIVLSFFSVHVWSKCRDDIASACSNGGSSPNGVYGYACPQMLMLSPDMINATRADGLDPTKFVYAVAGGSRDGECGMCYQVQLLDAEREWRSNFPYLVVQIFNTGFDVLENQLDLFMGAGGFGYFTACNRDCSSAYCQGGGCKQAMYEGAFSQWVQPQYNDPQLCYSGGVKWLDQKNSTPALTKLCQGLNNFKNLTSSKIKRTVQSCVLSNTQLLHQNFVATKVARVQCPPHLVKVTGLHRLDDAKYPLPAWNVPLTKKCQGDRTQGRYCITTMQDCCKPSCAWSNKVESYNLDKKYPCTYTCDRHGNVLQ